MAAYVRGLAGRQLTELASYVETRDLISSALAGGVREDCVDRAWRDLTLGSRRIASPATPSRGSSTTAQASLLATASPS